MENKTEHVKLILKELKGVITEQLSKKLDLDKCERIADKLGSFSSTCEECQQHLLELEKHLSKQKENVDRIDNIGIQQHKKGMNNHISHLQKKHKLVPEGYYLGIYMSIGISLGVVFGLTVFDNVGLGIPIGMSMGIAIGAGMDADAKKKGNVI